MFATSIALYLMVSLGIFAMGLKYVRAKPPLDYHANIMKTQKPSTETVIVLGALYKVMGGSLLALGFVMAMVTVFGVWNDLLWAKFATLVGGLTAGGFAIVVPRNAENRTGVRTPWRIAAMLTLLGIVAFLLSVI